MFLTALYFFREVGSQQNWAESNTEIDHVSLRSCAYHPRYQYPPQQSGTFITIDGPVLNAAITQSPQFTSGFMLVRYIPWVWANGHRCILLYCVSQILCFPRKEGLWQLCSEHTYWLHSVSNICSLLVWHILIILEKPQTSSLCVSWWSETSDLWCYHSDSLKSQIIADIF